MYVKGIVTAIDPNSPRVKLLLPDFDNFETGWFFVPQLCTIGDKSFNQIKPQTLVGACCTEDMQDGCVIGALYNDEDVCINSDENVKYITFEDGTSIKYDKSENELTLNCVGKINTTAKKTIITGDVDVIGNVKITGSLTVTAIIKSLTDVIANAISLFKHVHPKGHDGLPTGEPQ